MGIFSSYLKNLSEDATDRKPRRVSYFNELNVNGQNVDEDDDDFTTDEAADDEEAPAPEENQDQQPEGGDNPPPEGEADNANVDETEEGDEDDNFTLPEGQEEDQGDVEEEQPAEDAGGEEGGEEDNFTLQGEENDDTTTEENDTQDEVQEQPAGDEGGGDVPQDQPPQDGAEDEQPGGEVEGGEPPAEGEDGGDDNFTLQGNEGGGEDGGDPGAEGGEEGQDGGDNGGGDNQQQAQQAPADPSDNISDEDVKASEEQIYDSLTDDQKRIRTFNLKVQYKGIYEAIMTMVDNLNNIPKSADNLETLKKVITYSTKVKEILIDYIQYNFDKNPYLENYATYIKFMAIFRTISRVIEDMNAQKEKNKK
jgi:hypothetical protein